MPSALPNPTDCCSTCDDLATTQIPGPAGATGAAGAAGTDGVNAYSLVLTDFVQPAVSSNVTVALDTTNGAVSSWMGVDQVVYVETGGYYQVVSKPTTASVQLKNLGYTGNAAPGASILNAYQITAAGIKGTDGSVSGTAGGDVEGTYPNPTLKITTTKGDLIVNNLAAVAPRNTRLAVGTDGMTLHADSTTGTGLAYAKVDLADTTEVTGTLAVGNGGTGAASLTGHRIITTNASGTALTGVELTSGKILIGNSGNAPTVANLTEGSGITITSVAGSITIAATAATGHGFHVTTPNNGTPLATPAQLMWQTKEFDVSTAYTVANGTFAAPAAGYYLLTFMIYFSTATGVVATKLIKKALGVGADTEIAGNYSGATGFQIVSRIVYLAATDTVHCQVLSGGAAIYDATATKTYFEGVRIA